MRFFKLWILVVIICLMPYSVMAENGIKDDALIILSSNDVASMEEAVNFIEEKGGRIVHLFPTHILIGHISKEIVPNLVGQSRILSIHYDLVDSTSVEEFGQMAVYSVETWNKNYILPPPPKIKPTTQPKPLTNDMKVVPESMMKELAPSKILLEQPYGAGTYDLSEYMIGKIAVGVILPESIGSGEDWTSEEINTVHSKIQSAMNWWANRESRAGLKFFYDFKGTVITSYEPIQMDSGSEDLWINQVIGYEGINHYIRVIYYNYAIQDNYNTDWAFTIFVVDSSNDADGEFTDGYFAYAYLGGPFLVMTYDNDGWGIGNMDAVCAHETGHIFYALDEYTDSCSGNDYSGYLNVVNNNCEGSINCIMRNPDVAFNGGHVCHWTRGQIGIWDNNSNGILDILDTGKLILSDPIGTTTLNYKGTITVLPPLENKNQLYGPYYSHNDITVSSIANVQYKIDDGNWIDVENIQILQNHSHNGTLTARFEFTTPPLSNGTHFITVRAINPIGTPIQAYYATDTVNIGTGTTSGIIVYPNPFYSKDKQITFAHLPDNSTIKIFTIAGELVTTITGDNVTGKAEWQPVGIASGIYLYLIESEGKVIEKGKVGVLR